MAVSGGGVATKSEYTHHWPMGTGLVQQWHAHMVVGERSGHH